jgi:Asp-tRNA(Asn)/Glu-tRNA(Gln) amidotransferase A subunit family amidase
MGFDTSLIDRRSVLGSLLAGAATLALPKGAEGQGAPAQDPALALTVEDIAILEKAHGLKFSESERRAILQSVTSHRREFEGLRKLPLDNSVAPAFTFVPQGKQSAPGRKDDVRVKPTANGIGMASTDDIAFMPVTDLAEAIRKKDISSLDLTGLYLQRLKKYGGPLLNVISLTEERALKAAKRADEELARGKRRGPLHGIPFAVKDLFAAKGYPTTWGAEPYQNQVLDYDAAVVEKLEAAGAILCAKTSLGALAMNDHWFKGRTKNPWDPTLGSSGSSAGSSSAMAAGLVAFTIGTETLGSIMSPSHRCRVTGLRPTFGRVSRHGAMALSWTMDKAGPICRTAQDCALVLAAIHGADPRDPGTVDRPFRFRPDLDLSKLKIAYLDGDQGLGEHLEVLKSLGAKPVAVKFTPPYQGATTLLSVEAAAAFDELTRTGDVNTITESAWANIFRGHRFLPGVEYIEHMRARTLVMRKFEEEFADYDAIVASDRGGSLLVTTNLTGHPQLYIPMGATTAGAGRGLSIIGRLYDEGTILGIGARVQQATSYWKLRPDLTML